MMHSSICLYICLFLISSQTTNSFIQNYKDLPQRRLVHELLEDYDLNVRPVINWTSTLVVQHFFLLRQIIFLDSKEQKLKAFFFDVWVWKDEFLRWDPQQYEGITDITITRESIWLPDIVVFNQVGDSSNYYMRENIIPASVNYEGIIRVDTPQIYETTCIISIADFPFDVQECKLIVASWSQPANVIRIDSLFPPEQNFDNTNFEENAEWELLSTESRVYNKTYAGSPLIYSELEYKMTLRRRWSFYNRIIIVPTILISFLSLLVFFLPPESGEKVSLAITVFLSLSLNMLVISEYIPPNSLQTPAISKYTMSSLLLVCISLWLSVFVLNIQGNGQPSYMCKRRPSKRLVRLCTLVSPLLLIKFDHSNQETKNFRNYASKFIKRMNLKKQHVSKKVLNYDSNETNVDILTDDEIQMRPMPKFVSNNIRISDLETNVTQRQLLAENHVDLLQQDSLEHNVSEKAHYIDVELRAIRKLTEKIGEMLVSQNQSDSDNETMKEEWFFVAHVVDRVFALIYLFANIFCLLELFPYYWAME